MTISPLEPPSSPKLKPWHLDRAAVVYVRQSTPQQVADHQESTARQYALAERAVLLGWTRGQVVVIDDDLGKSGQSIEGRPVLQGLAPTARAVCPLPGAAGRRRRVVRPQRVQRPAPARADRDDERGR